jgi:hypothetical protein
VQLIEKENTLGFDSIRKMAEKTEGSFCYTILSDNNELYLVKGDNPLALYKFGGFYLYASTEDILKKAVRKLRLGNYSKVNIDSGDILKIDRFGTIEVQHFDYPDYFGKPYCGYYDYDQTALDILTEYAGYFGISPDDICLLMDYGYDEFDIEEMMYNPELLQSRIAELNLIEMC